MSLREEAQYLQEIEESPFYLKRAGNSGRAVDAYVWHLRDAHSSGNTFIAEKCYEQVSDTLLLKYLKTGLRLPSIADLQDRLKEDLTQVLDRREAYDRESFGMFFDDCWQRFTPRGRGKSPFSVDRNLLLHAAEQSRMEE